MPVRTQVTEERSARAVQVTADRKAARKLTGNDVRTMRVLLLQWSVQDFAVLLDVALSAIGRWEKCEDEVIVADRHFYNLLCVLQDVLNRVPDAVEKLNLVRNGGPHRGTYMLFGLYFGDTPWKDIKRSAVTSKTVLVPAPTS